jgi:hypothetical protein
MNKFIKILCLLLLPWTLLSQKVVKFKNPSFDANIPKGIKPSSPQIIDSWEDCSQTLFPGETPFDIQPGIWDVSLNPKHGPSYIGLVTRPTGSYESIGQKIDEKLLEGTEYSFSIHVATSSKYKSSPPMSSGIKYPYREANAPAILRIRTRNSVNGKSEIIYTSPPIKNTKWGILTIKFTPSFNVDYIVFEAYFTNSSKPTFGNILIDAINMEFDTANRDDLIHSDFEGMKKDIKAYNDLQLLQLIFEREGCSKESELLKPIVNAYNLIQNKDHLIQYLGPMRKYEIEDLCTDLNEINAIDHSRALRNIVNSKTLISNFNKSESQNTLNEILLSYISLKRRIIKKEILICY